MDQASSARVNGNLAPALLHYLSAIEAAPTDDAPRTALYAMISTAGMPHVLDAAQMRRVRSAPGPFEVSSTAQGETLLMLDGLKGHSLDTLSDPQNGFPFPAVVEIYQPAAGDTSSSILVCAVHYQTSDDADLAAHTGRLLALLRTVLAEKSGQMPVFEGPFNVWLSQSAATTPGGEQWRNNLYFYNVGDDRSSIEWIREIAHEYSHLALPPVGGDYTAPEAWANGYIGERLLVRWLADPHVAGADLVESVWGRTFSGYANFKSLLIDPPVHDFLAVGLSRSALARRDAAGMRYVIGLLLWVDENRGSKAVGDLLWNMSSPDPSVLFAPTKALGAPGPKGAKRAGRE